MPRYSYQATDALGLPQSGVRDAAGPAELAAELETFGWTVLNVGPEGPTGPRGVVGEGEAQALAEGLAGLTRGGYPLAPGLRALAEDLRRGRLRALVLDLAGRLEAGEPLVEALEAEGGRFPAHLRGLLLAGARSGQAGVVLGEFVGYAQVGTALRRSLWTSLLYPFVLMFAFAVLVVFVCSHVVLGFKSIFLDFGIDLPIATRFLIQAADVIAEHGPRLIVAPLVVAFVGWLGGRLLLDPASRRRLVCRLPLVGPLWRFTSLAEFSHYLGLLLENDLALTEAVPLAAEAAHDAELQEDGRAMAAAIASGASLAEASAVATALPAGFGKVLGWAEGHQSLPETLHMAGEIFEAHARTRASFVSSVVTVLTVIIVLWGCFFMVGALFLPLIQLISRLSG